MSRVCIAQIGAAHGVRGEVRLKAFTEDPLGVTRYGALESEDGKQRFEIEAVRPAKDMLVARLKGISDRDAAEALRNIRLYVARERLPATEADEFYHADLIGLVVTDKSNHRLGVLMAIHNFGAGDLLEISLDSKTTILIPFTQAAVPIVNPEEGKLVIDTGLGLV
jgi:16S rRNA processing protein RimM